jgi:hypothetical protein
MLRQEYYAITTEKKDHLETLKSSYTQYYAIT